MAHMIKRQQRLRKEINLIPLINIIFLLLIFFMVAGQIQRIETLNVTLPDDVEGEERRYLPIILYLDQTGNLAINGDVVTEQADMSLLLSTALGNLSATTSNVTIRADKHASAAMLVWLIEEVKKAGASEVSIITHNG